jgi:hypothetical protein
MFIYIYAIYVALWFGGQAGGALGSAIIGNGSSSATFNFWDSNANGGTGGWAYVDISLDPSQSLNSDGYTVMGSFDASSDTVTVTVIEN